MNIGITGSSGLVGGALAPFLTTDGHSVVPLVRNNPAAGQGKWDPATGELSIDSDGPLDAVVHLAGENVASGRWNVGLKRRIRDSRVEPTRLLCRSLAQMETPPKALICASAIGYYGNRGDEVLTEESSAGEGFLAEVCQQWEAAAEEAAKAGIRVVHLRFGVILSPNGGALKKMLLPFKLGAGGRVGSGEQFWSWVSIDDTIGAIHHALMTENLSGPVNVSAPTPATNSEFTRILARVLSRPALVPMPAFAARAALGEMANEMLLASQRVKPKRLLDTGFEFRHGSLEQALRHLLGR